MRFRRSIFTALLHSVLAVPHEAAQQPLPLISTLAGERNISTSLFASLEEFSRIVDISYCVGITGIYHPFTCASRCHEFPHFELVDTWNTGALMSDSCGYIAVDHGHNGGADGKGRIIVAFRGTYSLANTIVDLSTIPQEYVPYPADPDDPPQPVMYVRALYDYEDDDRTTLSFHQGDIIQVITQLESGWWDGVLNGVRGWFPSNYCQVVTDLDDDSPSASTSASKSASWWDHLPWPFRRSVPTTRSSETRLKTDDKDKDEEEKCTNCTVHTGFYTSYTNTRPLVIPHLKSLKKNYPSYQLHLVGHSLGGAVAALVGLECESLGWNPTITTFGEPRLGNKNLIKYFDKQFGVGDNTTFDLQGRYRRVTHVDDPVPMLPLREWGYRMHGGEIYISKPELSPTVSDLQHCRGDEDEACIAGAESNEEDHFDRMRILQALTADVIQRYEAIQTYEETDLNGSGNVQIEPRWGFPTRFKLWQLFFAHRDYFWRLGLCVPGGDPLNWGREKYPDADTDDVGREEL